MYRISVPARSGTIFGGAVMAVVEMTLRDDEHAEIDFSDELAGPVIRFAGNGSEVFVELEHEHLQAIVDRLAEWGWRATSEAEA